MDRINFDTHDQAYQESKQALMDFQNEKLEPQYNEDIRVANLNYAKRLEAIRKFNYTFTDRQRLEQEETEYHQSNLQSIDDKKENEINEAIEVDVQKLQSFHFGEEGRDAIEQRLVAQEQTELNPKDSAFEPTTENTPSIKTDFETANIERGEEFNYDDFTSHEQDNSYETLSEAFIYHAEVDAPSSDAGIEM